MHQKLYCHQEPSGFGNGVRNVYRLQEIRRAVKERNMVRVNGTLGRAISLRAESAGGWQWLIGLEMPDRSVKEVFLVTERPLYVVCGDNVALGIYPTMSSAVESILESVPEAIPEANGTCYAAFRHPDTGTEYTAVAVLPSRESGSLFTQPVYDANVGGMTEHPANVPAGMSCQ